MWGIRLLRLFLSLALGAGTVVGVPALVAPASAAPATCSTTYAAPGTKAIAARPVAGDRNSFSVGWIDIQVPDQRVVVDVDWGFDVSFGSDSTPLGWVLNSPQSQDNEPSSKADLVTGPLAGTFVMDDEAGLPFSSVSPASGRYRPNRPSSDLEGRVAEGQWRLLIVNQSDNTGTWGNYTLTLTFDCDADKDGVADASDNCPVTGNADQSNLDDDALGDACDLDIDGDTRANGDDGCPRIAAATASGCPQVGRTASLRYAKATKKLTALVRSDVPSCRADAKVTLYRAKPGKDTKLVVGTTTSNGRWARKAPKVAGRYYVKVASSYARGEAECGRARSKKERVP